MRATGSSESGVSKPTARNANSGANSGARSSDADASSAVAKAHAERTAGRAEPRAERISGRTSPYAERRSGRTTSRADEGRGDSASADARIAALRRRIDALNAQLARSIQERAQLALRIGAWKQLHGLPAADPRREREMLERVLASAGPGLERDQLARVFRTLFRESRALVVKARKTSTR